uniref:Biopterin-dependent aromatic amino acid hydroxylase family profile domain-containing protein n=1 Tax=Arundo donax TaxID=35708 RepID=A0A0A9C9A8_ARUDO
MKIECLYLYSVMTALADNQIISVQFRSMFGSSVL